MMISWQITAGLVAALALAAGMQTMRLSAANEREAALAVRLDTAHAEIRQGVEAVAAYEVANARQADAAERCRLTVQALQLDHDRRARAAAERERRAREAMKRDAEVGRARRALVDNPDPQVMTDATRAAARGL